MSVQRPLSPFMLGSYYRPQLTSVLSILHRITGLILCLGAVALIAWISGVRETWCSPASTSPSRSPTG